MADTQVGYFFHNLQTLCAIGLLKQREKSTLRVQQGERERERDITDEYSSIAYGTSNRVWLDG